MARLEDKLEALHTLSQSGDEPALRKRLLTILRGKSGVLIERAARIVQQQRVVDLQGKLVTAFETLCTDGTRRDPGCGGKAACLTALDHLDHPDSSIFLRAARIVQHEKAWGPPVDTAAPVRARAAMALTRFPEADATTSLGMLLADTAESVRRAAIEGLMGRSDAGGMLALRWQIMDGGAMVAQLECGVALVRSGGPVGLALVGDRLSDDNEDVREIAALALAESRSPDALNLLGQALDDAILPASRKSLIRAIVAHRSPGAARILDDLLDDGSDADARVVLHARLELPLDPRDRADLIERAAARGIRLPR